MIAIDDTSFGLWLLEVDAAIHTRYGLGVDDGIDWPSRQCFDDDMTILEAVDVWRKWQT